MLTFIHARLEAHRLTRSLKQSLVTERDNWDIDADRQGRPIVSSGRFRIVLIPRVLRLFDAIHLYCDETEVWLPLLARIRLRNVVRLFLIRFASDHLSTPEKTSSKARGRARSSQKQPA